MALLHLESSPYLLQHAHNPVDWHAWNDATLEKAKQEGKMLIISIGYSACHWCHVMERESFEDEEVARLMNEHFLCIKVDREERPDVDQLYMQAAHLISGRGGWPLNAFALPDGRPFFAGTYFPKLNWIDLLTQLVRLSIEDPQTLHNAADQITNGIKATSQAPHKDEALHSVVTPRTETVPLTLHQLNDLYTHYRHRIDFKHGGEKRAPKFPMPAMWEYLLHFHYLTGHEEALTAVNSTLISMARGGIYDHAGGGFARYSTDERWLVPHFEKMLYDNAQLVTLYSHAYQLTGHNLYKDIVIETLGFVERELTASGGGFYSALDADSEGEEGRFYVWKEQDIDALLGNESALFKEVYHITTEGNWEEGKNILHRKNTMKLHAENHGFQHGDFETHLRTLRQKLLENRSQRVRPGLDDKILCSWNALMVRAYFVASKALTRHSTKSHKPDNSSTLSPAQTFRNIGLQQLGFLINTFLQEDGSMKRNCKVTGTEPSEHKVTIDGMLDDYAFLISALLEAYQTVFDERYITLAHQLTEYCLTHFRDTDDGFFFYTHERSNQLVARMKELNDNVIPASNSEMALNLFTLGTLLDKPNYVAMAREMTTAMASEIEKNIYYHANWGRAALLLLEGPVEVAIAGPDFPSWMELIQYQYNPQVILTASATESSIPLLANKQLGNKTRGFVCRKQLCGAPLDTAEKVLEEVNL